MAGETDTGKETQETQVVLPEDLKGPEDAGSLADILERTRHQVLTEHPGPGIRGAFEPNSGEREEETPLEEETKPPEETPKEGEEKPPETKTPSEEEIPEGWGFKPKYKDHKEAEKGAREHQQKVTEATEATKREREAREKLEQENKELREKLTEKEAKPPEPPVKTLEELEAEQEARILAALEEIGGLDEGDPDYQKKVARAWRKAGVGGVGQPAIPDPQEIARLAVQQVKEELKAEEEAKRQRDEEGRQQQANADARTQADNLAAEAGLNMAKGTADYRLFWDVAGDLPENLKSKPFTEQVHWAVGEVRRLKGEVVQDKQTAAEKAREVQRQNTVLERGSNRPGKATEPEAKTYTLGGIINSQMNARRI
jgi:hypothetical protein